MTNTPDEAERLLDELLLPVNTHEAQIGRAYTIGHLLPLIRAGLAMQRLEQAMRETGMECANVGTNKDGAWCFLQCRDFSEPEGDGDTIPEAINAALDAAGVEK